MSTQPSYPQPDMSGHSSIDPDETDVLVVRGTVMELAADANGQPTHFTLANTVEEIRFRCIPLQDGGTSGVPKVGDVIEVYGYSERLLDSQAVAVEVSPVRREDAQIEQIPEISCPAEAKDAFRVFIATVMSLSDELRSFVSRLLWPSSLAKAFLTARASCEAHDNLPGGLLMHTAGMLRRIQALPESDFQSAASRETLLVACILHDLGKLSLGAGFNNFEVSHELRLIGLVHPEDMQALKQAQPSICEFLLFLLDPARRREPHSPVPEVHHLAWADRVGASLDASAKTFAFANDWTSTSKRQLMSGRSQRCYRAVRRRKPA